MTDTGNDESRALDSLRRIVRVLRSAGDRAERSAGVSGAQLFVLQQLASRPEQSVGDMMQSTLTSQSSVSEVVAKLVARRLVSRHRASDDARRVVLALTARGRAAAREAPASPQRRLIGGLRKLSATQRRQLATLLEAWLVAAGIDSIPATMFLEVDETRSNARGPRTSPKRSKVRRVST